MLVKKWSEALVLCDRVLKYADEVSAEAGAFRSSLKVGPAPVPGRPAQPWEPPAWPEEGQVPRGEAILLGEITLTLGCVLKWPGKVFKKNTRMSGLHPSRSHTRQDFSWFTAFGGRRDVWVAPPETPILTVGPG